jgi:hypothetical protein
LRLAGGPIRQQVDLTLETNYRLAPAERQGLAKMKRRYQFVTDEGCKRVRLIADSMLAVRKLAQYDGGDKVPATICAIANAVRRAEEIIKAIDERWPSGR